MTPAEKQIELATWLADVMRDSGHDIDAADVLDCLALAGLTLAKEPTNPASDAYFTLLYRGR